MWHYLKTLSKAHIVRFAIQNINETFFDSINNPFSGVLFNLKVDYLSGIYTQEFDIPLLKGVSEDY
jgi:hypothetical protein